MKTKKSLPITILLSGALPLLLLTSCGHFFVKSKSYIPSSKVSINEALVSSNVKPMGGSSGLQVSAMVYMAGSGTLDGPFIWRIEAEGQEGLHETLTVHRIKVTTKETRRSEWYPTKHLNKAAPFRPLPKEPGKSFAQFQIPGKLEVYPEKDGDFTVDADVSIKSKTQTVRKTVRFYLTKEIKRNVETINMASEIIKSFQDNPKEWNW